SGSPPYRGNEPSRYRPGFFLRAAKREWRPRAWLNHGGLDALATLPGRPGQRSTSSSPKTSSRKLMNTRTSLELRWLDRYAAKTVGASMHFQSVRTGTNDP